MAVSLCAWWVGLQVRTHAIRTAHENIDRTIKAADGILSQFDLARRVRSFILSQKSER